jgi:hypothetical protein
MTGEDWKNHPNLAGIDQEKLAMLQGLAQQGAGKNPSDMLAFLMQAASQGKKSGLNFNDKEIALIIEVLKMGKSPAEAERLDRMVNLMKTFR